MTNVSNPNSFVIGHLLFVTSAGESVCSGPIRDSCGQMARTITTTISVANPPPTTDSVGPKSAAVAPLSKAPNSFEKPMKT